MNNSVMCRGLVQQRWSKVWEAMEAPDRKVVTVYIPNYYPITLRLTRCNTLEQKVGGCWYPCRKAINTLMKATSWKVGSEEND